MQIIINTGSYNQRRMGKPWVARVDFATPKGDFAWGDWTGDSYNGGEGMTRKKRAATNHFKKSAKRRLVRRFGGCQICSSSGDLTYNPLKTHHVIPVRDGGETVLENCMILCRDCHTALHKIIDNNPVDTWAAYRQLKGETS